VLGPQVREARAATAAACRTRLAMLLNTKGNSAGAEPLYPRAQMIDEKALGPEHPAVAIDAKGWGPADAQRARTSDPILVDYLTSPIAAGFIALDQGPTLP
jgi:hypothetical protein